MATDTASRLWKRYGKAVIAAAVLLIFSLLLSIVLYLASPDRRDYVTATVSLNYDGVNSGLDPFKSALNLSSFIDEELVSEALGNLGLLEKHDVAEVMENLSISGNTSIDTIDAIVNDTSSGVSLSKSDAPTGYHPSTFTVRLWRNFDRSISARKMRALLNEITRLLSERFNAAYSRSFSSEIIGSLVTNVTHEYLHRLEVDRDIITAIRTYADALYEKYPYFSYEGSNYQTISRKCSNLIDDKVVKVESNITINGLTNRAAWIEENYEYNLLILGYDLDTLNTNLENIEKQITDFEVDSLIYMSSGDSIVKVESRSKETYEELVSRRLEIKSDIAALNSQIEYNTQRLEKIRQSSASAAMHNELRNDFEIIENKTAEISEEFNSLMQAQNEVLTKDMITVTKAKSNFRSLFSVSFIVFAAKRTLIVCLPVVGIAILVSASKKDKKAKKKKETLPDSAQAVS